MLQHYLLRQITGQRFRLFRTLGTTGTVTCFSSFQLDEKSFIANDSSIIINTTVGNNVELTAHWNTAYAENTDTTDQGFLEAMN